MRRLLLLALLAPGLAAATTLDFTLAGNPVGTNTFEIAADGTFKSDTQLAIGPTKISSILTGVMTKGKVTQFTLEEVAGPQNGKIEWKNGKVTIWANGKQARDPFNFTPTSPALFSNYHPQMTQTLLANFPQGGKATMTDTNSLTTIPVDLKVEPMTAELKSGAASLRRVRITLNGIEVVFAAQATENTIVGMQVAAQQFIAVARGYEGVFVDPLSKYPELSQPTHKTVAETRVRAPMRDGRNMMMDITRPLGEGKHPVILVRTPYGRASQMTVLGEFYAKRGYAVVVQDVRGTGGSDGQFDPFNTNVADGKDTLDWLVQQPWCDGNVGMIGGSYGGLVQWAAAVEQHPALKCIVPQVSPPGAFENIPYEFGVPMLWSSMWWLNLVKDQKTRLDLAVQPLKNPKGLSALPLTKVDDQVLGRDLPQWNDWMKRQTAADYAGFDYLRDIPKVKIPALHISGWWDGDGIGTKLNWRAARSGGNTKQWLIYGPWTHAFNTTSALGDVTYGKHAILELDSLYLRWFDTWLKGKEVGLSKVPKVQVFVTGLNQWKHLGDWPDKSSKPRHLYLGRKGNSLVLNGKVGSSTPVHYTYDPAKDIVPAAFSSLSMASEPSTKVDLPKGEGTLLFKSEALQTPTIIGGPLEVEIHFTTSAKDTDFFASVVDVKPNGEIRAIGMSGRIRASYLASMNKRTPLIPGRSYTARVQLWDLCHQFAKGHRIGLMISSSQFPMYARNLGTAEANATATKMVAQKNTIYMDPKRPSQLTFMVFP